MHEYLERVVDLTAPESNVILNMSLDQARQRVLEGTPEAVRGIEGSFALVARQGKTVRMARSLDRPLRFFLAKRAEGPALIVAERIDALRAWLQSEGFDDQFHPSYTRMVPAHHIVEIQLVGCPGSRPGSHPVLHPGPGTPAGGSGGHRTRLHRGHSRGAGPMAGAGCPRERRWG